jgi:hypothetical protein
VRVVTFHIKLNWWFKSLIFFSFLFAVSAHHLISPLNSLRAVCLILSSTRCLSTSIRNYYYDDDDDENDVASDRRSLASCGWCCCFKMKIIYERKFTKNKKFHKFLSDIFILLRFLLFFFWGEKKTSNFVILFF